MPDDHSQNPLTAEELMVITAAGDFLAALGRVPDRYRPRASTGSLVAIVEAVLSDTAIADVSFVMMCVLQAASEVIAQKPGGREMLGDDLVRQHLSPSKRHH